MRADLHVDTLWRLEEKGGGLTPFRDDLQIDAKRCLEGDVRLLCTAIFTEDQREDPWDHCCRLLDVMQRISDDPGEPFRSVTTPAELADLDPGITGMLATIENARCLEGELSRLDELHHRGVRMLGLTWNGQNELGQGVLSDQRQGLTRFGKAAVERAARLGWAIDISHLNREGVVDVCDSGAPVLATHSNARAIHDHPRNLSDEILRHLAEVGGLVGVNVFPPFLAPPEETATLDTVVRHVIHLMEFLGKGHVALGTDLDGISKTAQGFRDHRDLDVLASALGDGGLEPQVVSSVLGDGFIHWWSGWSAPLES
ncbi:MAG: membrane dipeptidase [Planctomycetota bacterium]